ncbi:MAG: thymidine phosphorylase [Syntrophomonadaceae bacterium]
MDFQEIILKKRQGKSLDVEEIGFLVKGISDGSIPDYQIAAWAMAVYFQGMDSEETKNLALAMAYSGEVVDLSDIAGIKVDKHSTGGVGDKTTLVVIPLVAAAGVPCAKMSGRGLGHTGGTIDKLESIPGFRAELTPRAFIEQVNSKKAAIISQTGNLVPADKKLYALRDVTGTVDSIPLIASSVMSKKIASGAQGILLDVKVGSGAFTKNEQEATELAVAMVEIGKGAGRKMVAVITDMDQPLGRMVGNSLEVKEALDTLSNKGPSDLEQLSLTLAAHLLVLGERAANFAEGLLIAEELLKTGEALKKFTEIIQAQGGHIDLSRRGYGLPVSDITGELKSPGSGYINRLDALTVGKAAMSLGAGRRVKDQEIDHTVGIELLKKRGEKVSENDTLAIVYGSNHGQIKNALEMLQKAFEIGQIPSYYPPLIIETIGGQPQQ